MKYAERRITRDVYYEDGFWYLVYQRDSEGGYRARPIGTIEGFLRRRGWWPGGQK